MCYYVVTLEHGDPLAERYKFHYLGRNLAKEFMGRARTKLQRTKISSFHESLEYAEIYSFNECAPDYKHLLPEWAKSNLPTPEYEQFGKVYFLNEVAFRMYKEGGIEFEVAKIIPDSELPKGCSRNLRAPYLPKEE